MKIDRAERQDAMLTREIYCVVCGRTAQESPFSYRVWDQIAADWKREIKFMQFLRSPEPSTIGGDAIRFARIRTLGVSA